MKKLFKVYNKNFKEFYVVADSFQQAVDYLESCLDNNNYGYTNDRKVEKIELIAEENISDGRQYFFDSSAGHLLIAKGELDS